jgi:drug/metabolite transporter (DMT)-like permease
MSGLSQGFALAIVLFVTLLWGSWFQAVKHTGSYPIYAFLNWLYLFSLIIVWGSIALLHKQMVPNGVFNEIAADIPRALFVLFCGAMYAIGMQLMLMVVGRMGLILSTSVSATSSILMGAVVASFLGGLPEGVTFARVLTAAAFLILATIVCQYSGIMRDRDIGRNVRQEGGARKADVLLLLFVSVFLSPFYFVATSIGLRSELRPEGFSSLTCMGILCIGAFIGTGIHTSIRLTREKKWHVFLHPKESKKVILGMAAVAAFCHFGGNVLHAIAAPVVSVVVATVAGNLYSMWSYVWGLAYREYKGASKRTYGVLALGIAMFITGVLIISIRA